MRKLRCLMLVILLVSPLISCRAGASPTPQIPTPAGAAETPARPTATTAAQEPAVEPTPTEAGPAVSEGPYDNYLFATLDEYEAFSGRSIEGFSEAPSLTEQVQAGKLPPLQDRLPKDVAVVRTREGAASRYGGELHLVGVMEGPGVFTQFTEDMVQGLMTPDASYERYYPNIAKGWTLSDDGKTLTVKLREGLKWSDGDDFDADDFVFWYEDILQNEELNPEIDPAFTPGGELAILKKLDRYTIEYSFAVPYYRAVERILGSNPFAAAHFIKQYLPKYNSDAEALAKQEGFDSWQQAVQFHGDYCADPKAPQLNPWIIKEIGPTSAVWVRNPYYWRVDTAGNQLPYIDTILVSIVQSSETTTAMKAMAGEDDWDCMGLSLDDYPVLKQNEAQGNYKVYLWPDTATSTALGFALNYTHKDPVLRALFNDLRFRQALSLAIDREDICETIFFGQTVPYVAPVSPIWTGYEDWMATYYAEHDVDRANALLDEIGLKWDAEHKWRLRPDGKPLTILGEHTLDYLGYVDELLQMVAANWAEIGVNFVPQFVPGDALMPRYVASEQDIGIWNSDGGSESLARQAYPIRLMPPWHWMGSDCCAMSSYPWRQWLDTNGAQGEEPPQEIKDLYNLVQDWLNTPAGTPEYSEKINKIIRMNVENLYYFGTVSAPPRVVVVSNRVGNLPAEDGELGSSMLHPYMPETAFIRE